MPPDDLTRQELHEDFNRPPTRDAGSLSHWLLGADPGLWWVRLHGRFATVGVNDVRVDRDVCHVRTVRVQAALVAVP
jgi:hypothetical protein